MPGRLLQTEFGAHVMDIYSSIRDSLKLTDRNKDPT